nr:short chain dehydrogenase sirr [Quercus suber]
MANRHAIVIGASSSIGWTVVDEILHGYGEFASVTAMVNRPLTREKARWTPTDSGPTLTIVGGLDLTSGSAEELAEIFRGQVSQAAQITHVFHTAYKQQDVPFDEYKVNACAGTRYYHRQRVDKPLPAPFTEEMTDWANESTKRDTFYYAWGNELTQASAGRSWSWCHIVPDAIVGIAPSGSTFALPIFWATWLSLYALKEGIGAQVEFPGNQTSFKATFNAASATQLSHAMVWAALNPERSGGGHIFNVADSDEPSTMEEMWPQIAAYFRLEGKGPPEDLQRFVMPSEYVQQHGHLLQEGGYDMANIAKASWLDAYGTMFTYDRLLSLEKIRKAGFTEVHDKFNGWVKVWDQMKDAGMIPV